jgi:hypothetical protein
MWFLSLRCPHQNIGKNLSPIHVTCLTHHNLLYLMKYRATQKSVSGQKSLVMGECLSINLIQLYTCFPIQLFQFHSGRWTSNTVLYYWFLSVSSAPSLYYMRHALAWEQSFFFF